MTKTKTAKPKTVKPKIDIMEIEKRAKEDALKGTNFHPLFNRAMALIELDTGDGVLPDLKRPVSVRVNGNNSQAITVYTGDMMGAAAIAHILRNYVEEAMQDILTRVSSDLKVKIPEDLKDQSLPVIQAYVDTYVREKLLIPHEGNHMSW